jgi:twitching motility protein PilT
LAAGKGRVAAFEFMVITPAIANLIRENKTYRIDSSIQTGKKLGMQLLDDHLWQLYEMGRITMAEMMDKARQPGALHDKAMARFKTLKPHERPSAEEDTGPILRM